MKYGFIGCGNMGGAIARALRKTTQSIMIADPSEKAAALCSEFNLTHTDNHTLVRNCERVFLAVKPQVMESVLKDLQADFKAKRPLVITMAAGLEITRIQQFIGCELPIIRIMPNTPVLVENGMIQYCCNNLVTEEMVQSFVADMQHAGKLDALSENLIDAASALSGSGPAYMYMFMDALADGAVACGLPRQKALDYAANTMIGAAHMVLQTHQHPSDLKDAVCSPGGSTIEGVKALEQHGFRGAVMDCILAAYHKNKELGK